MHLNGHNLSGQVVRSKGDDHAGLDDTSFDTTEGLVGRSGRRNDGVQSIQKGGTLSISFLTGDFPSLVPGHVLGSLEHVITVPSGDGDESDGGGIVADLLDEVGDFLEISSKR